MHEIPGKWQGHGSTASLPFCAYHRYFIILLSLLLNMLVALFPLNCLFRMFVFVVVGMVHSDSSAVQSRRVSGAAQRAGRGAAQQMGSAR